jgi:hypothetical protein
MSVKPALDICVRRARLEGNQALRVAAPFKLGSRTCWRRPRKHVLENLGAEALAQGLRLVHLCNAHGYLSCSFVHVSSEMRLPTAEMSFSVTWQPLAMSANLA